MKNKIRLFMSVSFFPRPLTRRLAFFSNKMCTYILLFSYFYKINEISAGTFFMLVCMRVVFRAKFCPRNTHHSHKQKRAENPSIESHFNQIGLGRCFYVALSNLFFLLPL